jgi:glycerophosphoryl diester phosphodiesterase
MLNIAHRGASGHAPEHTFAAFDLAHSMGVDFLELDVQLTRDGVIVVVHDETLDRTARGDAGCCTGRVAERTLEELRRCDVGRWFNEVHPDRAQPHFIGQQLPTLDDIFQRFGTTVRYYLELKSPEAAPGIEETLLALLDRHALTQPARERQQVLIESFSERSLHRVRQLDATLPLVQLLEHAPAQQIRERLPDIARYAIGVAPAWRSVDPVLVELAHACGLVVHPYTVNDVATMERFLEWGVDGIFTDFPDRLNALR